jgi:hypothetical protein
MIHADPLHYYPTQGSGNSNYKKKCWGQKLPCRTRKSSTWLHHQVHSFMAHGVDPLVEIGGQQWISPSYFNLSHLTRRHGTRMTLEYEYPIWTRRPPKLGHGGHVIYMCVCVCVCVCKLKIIEINKILIDIVDIDQ